MQTARKGVRPNGLTYFNIAQPITPQMIAATTAPKMAASCLMVIQLHIKENAR